VTDSTAQNVEQTMRGGNLDSHTTEEGWLVEDGFVYHMANCEFMGHPRWMFHLEDGLAENIVSAIIRHGGVDPEYYLSRVTEVLSEIQDDLASDDYIIRPASEDPGLYPRPGSLSEPSLGTKMAHLWAALAGKPLEGSCYLSLFIREEMADAISFLGLQPSAEAILSFGYNLAHYSDGLFKVTYRGENEHGSLFHVSRAEQSPDGPLYSATTIVASLAGRQGSRIGAVGALPLARGRGRAILSFCTFLVTFCVVSFFTLLGLLSQSLLELAADWPTIGHLHPNNVSILMSRHPVPSTKASQVPYRPGFCLVDTLINSGLLPHNSQVVATRFQDLPSWLRTKIMRCHRQLDLSCPIFGKRTGYKM